MTATIAVALHDGFYGCGTGAGYANRAFLTILADHLRPGVRLVVLPVRLEPSSPEYDPAWYEATRAILDPVKADVRPVDNGTGGRTRFGDLLCFRKLAVTTSNALTDCIEPGAGPTRVIAFDVPFLGLGPLLPLWAISKLVLVPRSSAVLHDPSNRERIAWESYALGSAQQRGAQVAAISRFMRHHLGEAYGLADERMIDLPDGLTLAEHHFGPPGSTLLPAPAEAGFLLAMGRAQPYKGWDDLLDALALLRTDGVNVPHTVLAAVTDDSEPGPYQQHLAARIAADDLDVTLLTRFTSGVRDLLTHPALRGVVVPSRTEPFGRIPLEAYAAGAAPVIATTAGGLAEQVIDGRTGFTARPADPRAQAAAIRRAVTITETQRELLRTSGREHLFACFDYTRAVRRFLHQVAPWITDTTTASYARRS